MNLAATTTSCDEESTQVHCPYPYVPTTPQATHDKSKFSSPLNSPPSSPPSIGTSEPEGMVSEDEDDNFPVTPNSKRSGGKHRAADTSPHRDQESSRTSTSESKRHTKQYHPYHHRDRPGRPTSGERYHDCAEQILRRNSCNQYSEGMSTEDQEALLRHIESMSTHSFHCAIHYKEAVRETLRLEFLYRGWLLETSRRLNVFNESLHHESEMELGRADHELRWLVHVLVNRGGTRAASDSDVPYLTAAREGSRKALDHADAEIAILKQSFPIGEKKDRDDKSEAVRVAAVL